MYNYKTVKTTSVYKKSIDKEDLHESLNEILNNAFDGDIESVDGVSRLQTDDMVIKVEGKNVIINGDVEKVTLNGKEVQ